MADSRRRTPGSALPGGTGEGPLGAAAAVRFLTINQRGREREAVAADREVRP